MAYSSMAVIAAVLAYNINTPSVQPFAFGL